MNESEVVQLCAISVRHGKLPLRLSLRSRSNGPSGVASLSFDELSAGDFVEGVAALNVLSDQPAITKDFDDLQTHPRTKGCSIVSDEQADKVKHRLRSPLGRTSDGDGTDIRASLEEPTQNITQPTAQTGAYFSPLSTVREADEEAPAQLQDQKAAKDEERRSAPEGNAESKCMNEVGTVLNSNNLGTDIRLEFHNCAASARKEQSSSQSPGPARTSPNPSSQV